MCKGYLLKSSAAYGHRPVNIRTAVIGQKGG